MGAVVVCVTLLGPVAVRADQVARLGQILSSDASYRVRMQAAIVLGRLRRPAAVPALLHGLADKHPNVRQVSAAALGLIGDAQATGALVRALRDPDDDVRASAASALGDLGEQGALVPLRDLARRTRNRTVREQAVRAIKRIEQASAALDSRLYITLGQIGNKTSRGGAKLAGALGQALLREFAAVRGLVARPRSGMPPEADIRRRKLKAFVLDGAVTSLTHRQAGPEVELSCDIRVSLATYPDNSMKAFYNGGASMVVSARSFTPSSAEQLYLELVVGAAQGARQHIVQSYLRLQ